MNAALRIVAVVPVHERKLLTLAFIRQWKQLDYLGAELVIVDDGSTDGTSEAIKEQYPDIVVLHADGQAWWAGATNLGITWALQHGADYVLTINDDAQFAPDFLTKLLEVARSESHAIVGVRIMRQDDPRVVWAVGTAATFTGRRVWTLRHAGEQWTGQDTGKNVEVDTLCGNGCLIPVAVFSKVGLFDAHNLPQYHADSDLVLRSRAAGFRVVVALDSVLFNHSAAPLPAARWAILFSKRSPLRLASLWTLLWRHAPRWRIQWILMRQCLPPLLRLRR